MPAKIYHVTLSDEERSRLEAIVGRGKSAARTITAARVLLKAADGVPDSQIVDALGVARVTCERLRMRCALEGVDACLARKKQENFRRKVTGDIEAHLVALSCSKPPQGRARWTLRLLADRAVELGYVDSISHETVGQVMKKTRSSLGSASSSASRPRPTPSSSAPWRTCSTSTPAPSTPGGRSSAWTKPASS